ncbi:MAG: hypothetical protein CALGDGBN_02616 [Pseudomonadales bacterium]|nr:hypothetical protein [Pseudomonadales bacterium]
MNIPARWRRYAGVTMVELLVAMVIGIFLIAGAVSIFIASKRSYTEVERSGRMIENARYAQQALSMDLRHGGFFGEAAPPGIDLDDELDDVEDDCTGRAAAYDVDNYVFVARTDGAGSAVGCIDDAVPGSDIVVIKGVRPRPMSDGDRDDPDDDDGVIDNPEGLDATRPYVLANAISGLLFDGADTVPTMSTGGDVPGGNAWEYRFMVYYIRAGNVPRLSRKVLGWDGASMRVITEDIVDGVENLRVRVGVDGDDNGEVDSYLAADDGAIDWGRVLSLEVYLLVRSVDADASYTDGRSYDLGGEVFAPGGNFHRTVVSFSVSLRNAKLLIRGNI